MTYRGRIRNGTIVLDGVVPLPEGAEVMVDVSEQPSDAAPGESLMEYAGKATQLPPYTSLNLDRYLRH